MKKKGFILLMAVLMVLGVASCGKKNDGVANKQERNKIVIGMSGGYKPYTFLNENDELQGFDVDVWKEIGARLDSEIEFNRADFSGLFGMLDNGQLNTIANQITVTKEREEKYIFTEAYVYYGAQLLSHKDDNSIKSLEDLKGKKVGVSLGSNYENMIREFDTGNEIEVVTYDGSGLYHDLSLGRIDAVLMDKLSGLTVIEESDLDIKLAGEPIQELINAFPFVKSDDNEKLVEEINKVMKEMKNDGTLTEISLKWFPIDITKK
ncbi:amino acid ABC transporter substrate-binding protein [Oceanirhabdus sp. W0125-5]|uniref:amino acid ABC transporter substrate-binding protein n=1 Tax=Oceanirhabdus sp. W0125-5 TaxID=2999116 RepID=UPI0022F2FAB7|nr:amino acid ABC transporter substrate-binding protein [Oceanirhabdus sp. W0125-5]WBW95508.1 amino acid ABC transporter substrate-binding protein [Oceanirhabdus sp. W0125-5]